MAKKYNAENNPYKTHPPHWLNIEEANVDWRVLCVLHLHPSSVF